MRIWSATAMPVVTLPVVLAAATLLPNAADQGLVPARGERAVAYAGTRVVVPRAWPVYDLARDPHRCIRFDVHAVYLGQPSAQQDCPAHLVGRTEAVWLAPAATVQGTSTRVTGALERTMTRSRVHVVTTYGADRATAERVAASASATSSVVLPVEPAAWRSAATSGLAAPAAATSSGRSTLIGQGFDACAAPSEALMKAWATASPYRAANIYIGGSVRACAQPNLGATWVTDVQAMGWRLIPTYVGLQAPCSSFSSAQRISSNTTTAAAQGKAAADDAAKIALALGLHSGSPVYFDMEPYSRTSSCSAAVMSFMSGWTQELHAKGWSAGAYGGELSLIPDLESKVGTDYAEPDDIWIANWNNLDSVLGDPAVSDTHWGAHQRIHQWHGGANEAYGGYTLNIDPNAVDGQVAGPSGGACATYASETFGPNGCTAPVAFTGPMQFWRLGAPAGSKSLMRWTYGNGSTEANGATWRPSLATKGTYKLSVWIPSTHATATATYTVTDASGPHTVSVNQSTDHGSWVSLGNFFTGASGTIKAHVSDAVPTRSIVAVDAMKFHLVQPLDTEPPTGKLTAPAPGSWTHPDAPVTLSGSFDDDTSVTKVVFYVADTSGTWQQAGTDTHTGHGIYTVSWPESYPDGAKVSVRADVFDTAGHRTTLTSSNVLSVDGVAPTAHLTAPTGRYTTGSSWTVKWAGTDARSGVATWDARKQSTSFSGARKRWTRLATAAPAATTTATFSGASAGLDYCFEVRAHDRAGNVSPWSRPLCRAVASDDRTLSLAVFWARYTNRSGYYDTTFTQTSRYGATATRASASGTQVAVLATTCTSCGRVRVFIGDTAVGTISLQGTWHHHHWLSVPAFSIRGGSLKLRVVSSGKRVRIDGFAMSTR